MYRRGKLQAEVADGKVEKRYDHRWGKVCLGRKGSD